MGEGSKLLWASPCSCSLRCLLGHLVCPFIPFNAHVPWDPANLYIRSRYLSCWAVPMMRLAINFPVPGSVCCSRLIAVSESIQMWIFVQNDSPSCLLVLRPVWSPCSAISRASPIAYSSASTTFLFVPRYVFRIFNLGSFHATLAPLRPEFCLELCVQKDCLLGRSVCLLASSVPFSLLPAKGAMFPEKAYGSTHSVYSVSGVVLMPEP